MAYSHPLSSTPFKTLLTAALNASKSANVHSRNGSIELVKSLLIRNAADSVTITNELLALKTAGPDHRIAIYKMLSFVIPSLEISKIVFEKGCEAVSKETSEPIMLVLANLLPSHLALLLANHVDPTPSTSASITKELQATTSKPGIRRAFATIVGGAIWEAADSGSPATGAFAASILSVFTEIVKVVAPNPLNSAFGPVEAFIAIAVILQHPDLGKQVL